MFLCNQIYNSDILVLYAHTVHLADVAVTPDTAHAVTDYSLTTPSVTVQANDRADVVISIVNDGTFEQTEQFQVDITAGDNNALGARTSMTVTITDDDCK